MFVEELILLVLFFDGGVGIERPKISGLVLGLGLGHGHGHMVLSRLLLTKVILVGSTPISCMHLNIKELCLKTEVNTRS